MTVSGSLANLGVRQLTLHCSQSHCDVGSRLNGDIRMGSSSGDGDHHQSFDGQRIVRPLYLQDRAFDMLLPWRDREWPVWHGLCMG